MCVYTYACVYIYIYIYTFLFFAQPLVFFKLKAAPSSQSVVETDTSPDIETSSSVES